MPEGRQSPPPESLHDDQISAPSSGHSADRSSTKDQEKQTPEDMLKSLSSNPTAPMDKEVEKKFTKSQGN